MCTAQCQSGCAPACAGSHHLTRSMHRKPPPHMQHRHRLHHHRHHHLHHHKAATRHASASANGRKSSDHRHRHLFPSRLPTIPTTLRLLTPLRPLLRSTTRPSRSSSCATWPCLHCTSHARCITLKQRHVYNESSVCMLAMLLCNLCNSITLGLFFAVKHLCVLLLKQLHQSGVTVASCTSKCMFLHHKDTTMATTTTFRKLAAQAAELTPHECQVESFTTELHDAH